MFQYMLYYIICVDIFINNISCILYIHCIDRQIDSVTCMNMCPGCGGTGGSIEGGDNDHTAAGAGAQIGLRLGLGLRPAARMIILYISYSALRLYYSALRGMS